jgi:hypothetical protein
LTEEHDDETTADLVLLDPSAGGRARARNMSADERSEAAKLAASARWQANVPLATHVGILNLAGTRLHCANLADGTRLIAQGDMLEALGRSGSMGRRGDGAAPFVAASYLRPYVSAELENALEPIKYRAPGQRFVSTGYDATLLPEICDVYLRARDAYRDSTRSMPEQQLRYVERADVLIRALAKTGVVALVDEATGYQETRARNDLQRLVAEYVDEGFRRWVARFPDDFFTQALRVYGYSPNAKDGRRRPGWIGSFINTYIYDQFPDGVLDELQRVNPTNEKGRRSRAHHQHLTETTGNIHLDRQITAVLTLMHISRDQDHFKELFKQRFPGKRKVLAVRQGDDGEMQALFEFEDFDQQR